MLHAPQAPGLALGAVGEGGERGRERAEEEGQRRLGLPLLLGAGLPHGLADGAIDRAGRSTATASRARRR